MANLNPYSLKDPETGRLKKREELLPIQYDMIVELIANGGNKKRACEKLGVNRQTLYNWLDNDIWVKEYKKACEKLYKSALQDAINGIVKVAKQGSGRDKVKACETILKLNGYLNTAIDVNQNTTENIIVTIDTQALDNDIEDE